MKVVHLATSIFGGAGTAAYRIHKSLVSNGIDSTFLSFDCSKADGRIATHQFGLQRMNRFKVVKRRFWNLALHLGFSSLTSKKCHIKNELEQIKNHINCEVASLPFSDYDLLANPIVAEADIIHLHWVAGLLDYSSFFRRNKKPVVWTCHDLNPFLGLYHYKGDEIRNESITKEINEEVVSVKEKAIKGSKMVLQAVCPSTWLQTELSKSSVFSTVQSQTIFYPVDFGLFCPRDVSSLRRQMEIPDNHTVFLFVAETVHNYRKGFDLLQNALLELDQKNVSFLIIGATKGTEIKSPNVYYLGSVNDDVKLSHYYSLADAFIIPSREDNLPNVMIEALACGTPVLSFDVGGMQEVIVDRVNGLKIKHADSSSLAKSLSFFIKNKLIFNRELIRQIAYENFEPAKISQSYIQLYASVLN